MNIAFTDPIQNFKLTVGVEFNIRCSEVMLLDFQLQQDASVVILDAVTNSLFGCFIGDPSFRRCRINYHISGFQLCRLIMGGIPVIEDIAVSSFLLESEAVGPDIVRTIIIPCLGFRIKLVVIFRVL